MARKFKTDRERFDEKWMEVPETGCWIWLGSKTQSGKKQYGNFSLKGSSMRAHRASWIIYNGNIPDGMQILHSCDIGICVNPEHLRLGTHQENMQEMVARGRHNNASKGLLGEAHWNTRLSDKQIMEMKRLRAEGAKLREIAEQFDCSEAYASRVIRGKKRADPRGPSEGPDQEDSEGT